MKDALDHATLEERYEAEFGAHLLTSVEFAQQAVGRLHFWQ